MKSTRTFRVDHKPLLHKNRRVWGGALVPAVLVFFIYTYILLSCVCSFDKLSATGRGLLAKYLLLDMMNHTIDSYELQTKTAFDNLSMRADELAVSTCFFAAITSLTSLCLVCILWRRVNQLQHMEQHDSVLRV